MELDEEELEATRNRKKVCKNCNFFEKLDDCKFYGICKNKKFEYEAAYCYEKNTKKEKIEKDKLFYMDYEGYNAGVEVGEEFGCIHFENRKLV